MAIADADALAGVITTGAVVNVSVTGQVAAADAAALAGSVSAQVSTSIAGELVNATADSLPASISGVQIVSVAGEVAAATADGIVPTITAALVAGEAAPPTQPLRIYLSPGRLYIRPPELVIVHHSRARRVTARCVLIATPTIERAPEAVAAKAQAGAYGMPAAERAANPHSVASSASSHGTAYRLTRLGYHRRLLARSRAAHDKRLRQTVEDEMLALWG